MVTFHPCYDEDLAYVHDVGFSGFALQAAPGLLSMLHGAGIHDGLVVDLGCGSGVWAQKLVRSGYDVIGVDLSSALIERARQRVRQAQFHVGSFLSFELPSCHAVTALGEVLNYCFDPKNGLDALRSFFERVHAALQPGGFFIFDIAEPGRSRDRDRTFSEGDDWAVLVEYQHDVNALRLCRRIVTFRKIDGHYRRSEETHRLQLYRGSELAHMLRALGFRVRLLRSYGDFRLPQAMVAVVARKMGR